MIAPASFRFARLLATTNPIIPAKALSFRLLIQLHQASSSARLYTEKHEWITIQDGKQAGRVGISNHAQEALGDVVYVQLPDVGAKVSQFDEVGAIESVKAASELLSPVSGEVIKTNSDLENKPALVNSDCYGQGWLFDIKLDDASQLDKLMNEQQYQSYLEGSKEN